MFAPLCSETGFLGLYVAALLSGEREDVYDVKMFIVSHGPLGLRFAKLNINTGLCPELASSEPARLESLKMPAPLRSELLKPRPISQG